jgi:uncharacterized protein with ATP-grasp and redox domains
MEKVSQRYTFPGLQPECFACYVRRSFEAVQHVTDDRHLQLEVIREVTKRLMEYPHFLGAPQHGDFEVWFLRFISWAAGRKDPYSKLKAEFNQKAMGLYPLLKQKIAKSEDRLLTAAIIASAGNIIDEVGGLNFGLEESLKAAVGAGFKLADYQEFKDSLSASRQIVYIADNAGEVVFDSIFIARLKEMGLTITLVVKEDPFFEDVTATDVSFFKLDRFADNILTANGYFIPNETTPSLSNCFKKCDLVIAKGTGCYEALEDELNGKTVIYLLKVKCKPIATKTRANIGSFVVKLEMS